MGGWVGGQGKCVPSENTVLPLGAMNGTRSMDNIGFRL